MSKSPTAREFFGLGHDLTDDELRILVDPENRSALKKFLAELRQSSWHTVSYDQSIGLIELIKGAVGESNHRHIHSEITQDRFPLKGTKVRTVRCRVEPYLEGESREKAAKRLIGTGNILASTGDLVGFLHDHPVTVERWKWVDAIADDSQYTRPVDDSVFVPCARVDRSDRRVIRLHGFCNEVYANSGVLVLEKQEP